MTLPRIDPTPEEQQTGRDIAEHHYTSYEDAIGRTKLEVEIASALASARARDQQRIRELEAEVAEERKATQHTYRAGYEHGLSDADLKGSR